MDSIHGYLSTDHRHCDEMFPSAEAAVANGDWTQAQSLAEVFFKAMDTHFRMEEEVLFPAFEKKTGMNHGPTVVMRVEHQQMRGLLSELQGALEAQDQSTFLGLSETLLVLLQQHNLKEEQILYGMSDQVLGDEGVEVIGQMQELRND